MKKIAALMVACLAIGASAHAATLTVTPDQASYGLGANITLTVTGDAQGASSLAVLANLLFSGSGGVTWVSGSQVQMTSFGGALPWTTQPLTGNSNSAVALSQLAGLTPLVPDTTFSATITLQAASIGVVNLNWDEDPGPNQLDFFGLSGLPLAGSFTIVPEPSTAALLGLGLLGLALSGRRR